MGKKAEKKDFTIEFVAEIVEASSWEEAMEIANKLVREGKVEVGCVEETDYSVLSPLRKKEFSE